ncbi:hypothetical protein [Aliiroseovarius sp. YM-037]|uniref:hypothetical protein n=1 Tax=Aliiroseovarius sp. YM-037 TaxID=3341728 RepID=UPI003A80D351
MTRLFGSVLLAGLCFGAAMAEAELPPLACEGAAPDWTLTLAGPVAQLTIERPIDMTVPQSSVAEGADWPRALTLVGDRDTAIVILDEEMCSTAHAKGFPIEAHILTQRGTTPILLTGCCTVAE